jgi:hypothetical protein
LSDRLSDGTAGVAGAVDAAGLAGAADPAEVAGNADTVAGKAAKPARSRLSNAW